MGARNGIVRMVHMLQDELQMAAWRKSKNRKLESFGCVSFGVASVQSGAGVEA